MGYNVREIEKNDAEIFIQLCRQLEKETSFMLLEPYEQKYDLLSVEKNISDIRQDDFKEIFVLMIEERLVGFVSVMGENLKKIKHRAYIVIGLLQEYNGKGYGKELLKRAESWALSKGIRRLELTVMTHNKKALWLYSTMGFNVEGIRRKALVVDNSYVDEFYMSKML